MQTHPWFFVTVTVFKTNCSQVKVFDGPGIKSIQIPPSREVRGSQHFVAKSFEVTVYHLKQHAEGSKLTFGTSLAKISFRMTVMDKTNSFHFPSFPHCNKTFVCNTYLKTGDSKRFNLTLSNFIYEGDQNTEHCKYAGIWIFDAHKNFHQIFHDCVKENVDTFYRHDCYLKRDGFSTSA